MQKLVFVLALIGSSACLSEVLAQSDHERAAAREAAGAGLAAYEAGEYQRAIDSMSRAEQLVHALPHLLYLARAQSKLGRLVAARETYLKIARERLAENAPPAFIEAQAAALEERQ